MTVGDQNAGTVNRVNGWGPLWPAARRRSLVPHPCDVAQDFIGGGGVPTVSPARITAPETSCGVAVVFPYFVAAAPVQATATGGLSQPLGAAISP
ncbi:MAG TPA: hypothetical protein VKR56_07775 [Candidatus Cybelea sp.]|nr:hypothetical protein [Candidatus Cybelea sp.]